MALDALVQLYGYPAIFAGTMIEGETVLILGGFFAHRGYLDLRLVMAVAYLGALISDNAWFWAGRRFGLRWLERRPGLAARAGRVRGRLARYDALLMLSFRFLVGLRTVTPLLLGATGVAPLQFLLLDLVGAATWVAVIGSLGWAFGAVLSALLTELHSYEHWVLLASAGIGLATAAWTWWRNRRPVGTP